MTTVAKVDFPTLLAAPGRSPEIPEAADVYGWLIGSWELDVRHYGTDVTGRGLKGEVHFGWVLEGRAVQDVWIMPRYNDRAGQIDRTLDMYGTRLRVWDAAIQGWRITWIASSLRYIALIFEVYVSVGHIPIVNGDVFPPGALMRVSTFSCEITVACGWSVNESGLIARPARAIFSLPPTWSASALVLIMMRIGRSAIAFTAATTLSAVAADPLSTRMTPSSPAWTVTLQPAPKIT